ncbi:hypothetical protein KCU95_g3692, partial [Aureobasidium melanogenum]
MGYSGSQRCNLEKAKTIARQRTQSQGAQAQVPLTPNLSVRATGPSITSGIDDPGTLGHDDMTYLASDGFGDSMMIDDLNFFEQLSQIDLPFPWNFSAYT